MHVDEVRKECLKKLKELFDRIQLVFAACLEQEVMIEFQRIGKHLIQEDGFIRQAFVSRRCINVDLSRYVENRFDWNDTMYFVLRIFLGLDFGIVVDAQNRANIRCSMHQGE